MRPPRRHVPGGRGGSAGNGTRGGTHAPPSPAIPPALAGDLPQRGPGAPLGTRGRAPSSGRWGRGCVAQGRGAVPIHGQAAAGHDAAGLAEVTATSKPLRAVSWSRASRADEAAALKGVPAAGGPHRQQVSAGGSRSGGAGPGRPAPPRGPPALLSAGTTVVPAGSRGPGRPRSLPGPGAREPSRVLQPPPGLPRPAAGTALPTGEPAGAPACARRGAAPLRAQGAPGGQHRMARRRRRAGVTWVVRRGSPLAPRPLPGCNQLLLGRRAGNVLKGASQPPTPPATRSARSGQPQLERRRCPRASRSPARAAPALRCRPPPPPAAGAAPLRKLSSHGAALPSHRGQPSSRGPAPRTRPLVRGAAAHF